MPYYDPYRRRFVAEADAQVEPFAAGVVLVRAHDPDAPWFVHDVWTGASHRLEDFGDAEDTVRARVKSAIECLAVRERLLQRCDDVRGLGQVPPMDESEGRSALYDAMRAQRDLPGVEAAIGRALHDGFVASEIAFALQTLQDQPTLSDALDGVEVVSVSQLVERRAPAG